MVELMELRIPHMGSVENARFVAWHVAEGEAFAVGQLLYEVETDKTLSEVTALDAGVLARREAGDGDELEVGDRVGWWVAQGSSGADIAAVLRAADAARGTVSAAASDPALQAASGSAMAASAGDAVAGSRPGERQLSPRVRQLAREHGIDPATLCGTGPGGRVTGEDVLCAVATREAGACEAAERAAPVPPGYADVPCEARTHSLRRRTIARRLADVAREVPMLTADMQIDMGAVLAARTRLNAQRRAAGEDPVSVLAFVAAAVCRLLPQHPTLNATFTDTQLLCWQVVNLGIAVDTGDGLIVPVVRGAGRLSLAELAAAIAALAARARAGTLRAEELEGGTFTISNPGSLGPVLRAEAILNPPQVALLGLPGLQHVPVAVADGAGAYRVEVRPVLRPSITFDHRALDGGHVIRFLDALKSALESA